MPRHAFGRLLLPDLQKRGVTAADITATGRNTNVLATLAADGYRTTRVDLDNADQISQAIAGQEHVVLISGNEPHRLEQHRAVIDAAKTAGARHFYYTSAVRADDPNFVLAPDHRATEELIKSSGLTYTILRNGWYIEIYLPNLAQAGRTGVFAAATGDAPIAPVARCCSTRAWAPGSWPAPVTT